MKKIIFGITNLNIGGAEKTLIALCNSLCSKYDITIFTLYGQNVLQNTLNSKINVINLYETSFENLNFIQKKFMALKIFLSKKLIYNKYLKNNYDIEIAFLEGPITTLFSVKNNHIKKIAWVHSDISLIFGNGLMAKIKKIFNKYIYNKYNEIIFVSKTILNSFEQTYSLNTKKDIINNYIDVQTIIKKSNEYIPFKFDENIVNFLTVARLVQPKAIDRLIQIHSQLINNGFYHKFYVIGSGPEQDHLLYLINKYNVTQTFILLGEKENPYPFIKNCTCFCLLSYFEGYGIVLDEAKVLGKPIITNTISQEAVINYDNKLIVENNPSAIYNGLKEIITKNPFATQSTNVTNDNSLIIKKIIEKLGD